MAARHHLQTHGTGRTLLVRGLFVVLAVVIGYLIFEYGRISAGYDVVDAAAQRGQLEDQIDALNERIAELKQEVARLETNREIDREAYKRVEGSLLDLQAIGGR